MRIDLDHIEVPTEELDQVIEEKMKEIRKISRRRRIKKVAAACVAAVAVFTGAVMFLKANPVIAAQIPLVGHLFEKVEDKMYYSGDIQKNAQVLEGDDKVQASGGIRVTLSEAYCNPEALYMTILIESEEEFPERLRIIDPSYGENMPNSLTLKAKEIFDFMPEPIEEWLRFSGEYIDEHTFAGGARIDFSVNELQSVEIPEQFTLGLEINEIAGYDLSISQEEWLVLREARIEELLEKPEYTRITDEDGQMYQGGEEEIMPKWIFDVEGGRKSMDQAKDEYNQAFNTQLTTEEFKQKYDTIQEQILSKENIGKSNFMNELAEIDTITYEGTWELQAQINNKTDHAETIPVNAISPDGYGIESVTKTPYELIINEKFTENEEVAPIPIFFDATGREMTCKANMEIPIRDYDISTVYIYYYNCDSQETQDQVQEHSEKEGFQEYMEGIAVFKVQFGT